MEQKIEIICPVSIGDKLYRINDSCKVVEEFVNNISIRAKAGFLIGGKQYTFEDATDIEFSTNSNRYSPNDLGKTIFLDKKELIQKLVNQL